MVGMIDMIGMAGMCLSMAVLGFADGSSARARGWLQRVKIGAICAELLADVSGYAVLYRGCPACPCWSSPFCSSALTSCAPASLTGSSPMHDEAPLSRPWYRYDPLTWGMLVRSPGRMISDSSPAQSDMRPNALYNMRNVKRTQPYVRSGESPRLQERELLSQRSPMSVGAHRRFAFRS